MKIVDQFYTCQMPGPGSGTGHLTCHLRIFQAQTNVCTVLVADMAFELGWFNPCVIETMVEQVVQAFHLDPTQLVWLEHYAADARVLSTTALSQVVFEWQDGKATNPRWLAIAPATARALIGETLQLLPV